MPELFRPQARARPRAGQLPRATGPRIHRTRRHRRPAARPGAGREQTWGMRSRPAALACSAALVLSGALAGCSTATSAGRPPATAAAQPGTEQPTPADSPAALSATDWTTYHRDAARTGVAPASPAAGP